MNGLYLSFLNHIKIKYSFWCNYLSLLAPEIKISYDAFGCSIFEIRIQFLFGARISMFDFVR
jgi:hypothetical protein